MSETEKRIMELIRQGENLSVEFKSDVKSLSDRELVAAIVALANTEGGDLFLGVEDNGTVTGLHANHLQLGGLPALIANKTTPSLSLLGLKLSNYRDCLSQELWSRSLGIWFPLRKVSCSAAV